MKTMLSTVLAWALLLALATACQKGEPTGDPDSGTDTDTDTDADSDSDSDTDTDTDTGTDTAVEGLQWIVVAGGECWIGDEWCGQMLEERVAGVAVFDDGSSIMAGAFGVPGGTAEAVFGQGEPNETTLTADDEQVLFIARFAADGSLDWARQANCTYTLGTLGVVGLPDEGAVVVGTFDETATFGPGESNETVITSYDDDAFIARYSNNGDLVWVSQVGGTDTFVAGVAVASLSDGTLLVAGHVDGSAIFGAGETNETTVVSPDDGAVIYAATYNADGSFESVVRAEASQGGSARDVAVFDDNSFALVGGLSGTAVFGLGETNETTLVTDSVHGDAYIARYDADGTLDWVKQMPSETRSSARGVVITSDGNIAVHGHIQDGEVVFGEGEPNETVLVGGGEGMDLFIASFDGAGLLQWAKRAGGEESDTAGGISALPDGSLLVSGAVGGCPAVFGEGEVNETTLYASTPYYEIYVARYAADGGLDWVIQAGGDSGDWANDIQAVGENSFLVTGSFGDGALFGAGEVNETVLSIESAADMFLARYSM